MSEPQKIQIDLSGLRERIAKACYDKVIETEMAKLNETKALIKDLDKRNQKAYNEKVSNMILGTSNQPKVVGQMVEPSHKGKANYEFVSFEKIVKKDPLEYIDPRKVDYLIHNPNKADCKLKEDMPMSFLEIQEGEIQKGKNWYMTRDPKLPDGIAELMARYNWGDLKDMPNKKQYKNAQKKAKKKGKDILDGLEVKTGGFVLKFD